MSQNPQQPETLPAPTQSAPVMSLGTSGAFGIAPGNFQEAWQFAQMIVRTDLCPKAYRNKPESALVAMQFGGELGLSPMQSLQNVSEINGRAALWGDAVPAVCMRHPDWGGMQMEFDAATQTAKCSVWRKGNKTPFVATFSKADAQAAGLLSKDTYKQYLQRMLTNRARSWALRDAFPDALRGLMPSDEAQDIPPDEPRDVTAEGSHTPAAEPAQPAQRKSANPPAQQAQGAPAPADQIDPMAWARERMAIVAKRDSDNDTQKWLDFITTEGRALHGRITESQKALLAREAEAWKQAQDLLAAYAKDVAKDRDANAFWNANLGNVDNLKLSNRDIGAWLNEAMVAAQQAAGVNAGQETLLPEGDGPV